MVSHPLSMRKALGSIPSASMRSAVRHVRIPTSGPCGGADNPQLWLAGTRQYPHHRTLRCAAGGAGRLERVRASCAGVALASQPLRRAARHGYVADHNMSCTWTHWDLNPGPSACEADVIPLHHVPLGLVRGSPVFVRCTCPPRYALWPIEPPVGIEPTTLCLRSICSAS